MAAVHARFDEVVNDDGSITVQATGEVDLTNADFLVTVFVAALTRHRPHSARVDLAGTRFIDSQGLAALVSCYNAARDAEIRFSVVNATGLPARLMHITGVAALFELPTLDDPTRDPAAIDTR